MSEKQLAQFAKWKDVVEEVYLSNNFSDTLFAPVKLNVLNAVPWSRREWVLWPRNWRPSGSIRSKCRQSWPQRGRRRTSFRLRSWSRSWTAWPHSSCRCCRNTATFFVSHTPGTAGVFRLQRCTKDVRGGEGGRQRNDRRVVWNKGEKCLIGGSKQQVWTIWTTAVSRCSILSELLDN